MWQKIKKFNDDAWKTSCVLSFCGGLVCLRYVQVSKYAALAFVFGVLYEQFVEWLGHMLQHCTKNRTLKFYRKRHGRHHARPRAAHALQPLAAVLFVFPILLSGPIVLILCGRGGLIACGWSVIGGFLLAYTFLCLQHYDMHADKKIMPAFIRNTPYYCNAIDRHLAHHAGAAYYCVTNPWFDDVMEWTGLGPCLLWLVGGILRGIDFFAR